MKKFGLTIAAVAALGLSACNPASNEAGNNTTDLNATENAASDDLNLSANEATDATNSALDSTANGLDAAGATLGNAASDVGNAAEAGVNAVGNAL
jgi:hypothetical protein